MMRGLVLVLVTSAACGGGAATNDAGEDARTDAPPGPCWPIDGTTPRGTIQLGADEGMFVPMSDELRVVYGPQGGFHMPVHARATSIVPGNPADVFDPSNPRTRFHASFDDTGERITLSECGVRLAYEPATGAEYEMQYGHAVLFDVLLGECEVFDQRVRITLEVIDAAGSYARTEKVITTRAPIDWPTSC